MDSFNSALYNNISKKFTGGNINAEWAHDEDAESTFLGQVKEHNKYIKDGYIRSLLNPEWHISKVPSPLPVDSAVAQLKYNFAITPNASGYFALILDPFYQTGYLYQDNTVNGNGAGVLTSLTFSQDATITDEWRLVSSSLILKYFGNFNQMGGIFVAATTSNVSAATQTTYLTFSNVEYLTNKQVIKAVDGVKLIFTPDDDNAQDFNPNSTYSAGTHPCRWQYLMVVIGYLFPNTPCLRADFFRNIEYKSTPYYKQYIPQDKITPCDKIIPNIDKTVMTAPQTFRSGSVTPSSSNSSALNDVVDFGKQIIRENAKDIIQSWVPNSVRDSLKYFPGGFDQMTKNIKY
jgi:hypothetical protein